MKNIKRLLSILLVLSMTMSLIIVPNTVYADLGDNDYLVADFTENDSAISSLKFKKDTEVCYEDGEQSAKWMTSGKFKSTGSGIYYLDGAAGRTVDLSAMVSLHIIMNNAENVGNELNIVFRNAASTQGYFQKKIALDWTGWKEIIIPLSDFGKKNISWDEIQELQFNYAGWGAAFLEHSPIYFDSIWFEGKPVPQTIEIANAEKLSENTEAFKANTEYKRLYSNTAEWNGSQTDIMFDARDYYLPDQEYLYQWIYSPEATGEEIKVQLVNSADSTYMENTFEVDWAGWKLVEFYTYDFYGSGDLAKADTYRLLSGNSKLYFDRIWFAHKTHSTVLGSDLYATTGKLPEENAQIKLRLSQAISGSVENAIEIKANGNDFSAFTANQTGNVVSIDIPELERGVKYSLTIADGTKGASGTSFSDVTPIEFSAYDSNSTVKSVNFTDESGNAVTSISQSSKVKAIADVSVENGDNATVIIASYKGDVMTEVVSATGTGTIETQAISTGSQNKIEAWVVSDKYGVIAHKVMPDQNEDVLYIPYTNSTKSFSLNGVYQDDDGFVLDMNYSGAKRQAVAIVTDTDNKVILSYEFYIDSDTQYLLDAKNIEIKQGEYNVLVSLVGDSKVHSAKTFYITAEEEAEALKKVNDSTSYNDVLKLMGDYSILFRVNNVSNTNTLEHFALVVFEGKSYNSFDEIHTKVTLAKTALDELNDSDWSQLEDYFVKYDIALNDSEAADDYNSLSEDEKPNLCKELVEYMPYGSFIELRNAVSEIIADYKKTGTFGDGKKPDISGISGGKDKLYWGEADKDTENNDFFVDLDGYEWAAESIYKLLEKNIITISEDGKFRPSDSVTRAEFVKLLVSAIGLNTSEKEDVFADVKADDWYAPYFTAAKKAGIVEGYADNTVGPAETIKRQDIAVMLKRALDALGIEFAVINENVRITDIETADDYARDAITMVVKCGMMSGTGKNQYSPKEITNRASSAVVIARLMKGIEAGGTLEEKENTDKVEFSQMKEYKLLKTLGIIKENDLLSQSKAVTRRELARAMAKIVSAGEEIGVPESDSSFSDVSNTDTDYATIKMLVDYGYMTVYENKFRPDESVSMYDFVRTALCILGYKNIAESAGGYPAGYMNLAIEMGLTRNGYLDSEATINGIEFINLLYNTLDASPAKIEEVSDNFAEYNANEENTLLYEKFDIYRLRGIFEADMYSDILKRTPRASNGFIIVAGNTYSTQLKDINNLVGHMTETYINKETEEVVAMFSYETEEIILSARDVEVDDSEIIYFDSNGKSKRVKFSEKASVLYNGRQTGFKKSLFEDINGYIVVIDYNEDRVGDVIKLYNYSTIQVNNVSTKSGIITDSMNGRSIVLNELTEDEGYLIYKNGKKATLKDIKADDIISYTEVNDPKLITIYASDNTIRGNVETSSEDEVVINGEKYYIAPSAQNRIVMGSEIKFHLDFLGQIASTSTTLDMVYGYLHQIYKSDSETEVYARIFTENNRWVELELADKVVLNGKGKKPTEVFDFFGSDAVIYRQLIRYNVNDDAKIRKIYTAEEYEAWTKEESEAMATDKFRLSHKEEVSKYHNANKILGAYMPLANDTKIFLVPPESSDNSRDGYYVVNYSSLTPDKEYKNVKAYNSDETFVPEVVVIPHDKKDFFVFSDKSSISPFMIVTGVEHSFNDLEELCYGILGGFNGSAKIRFNTRDMSNDKIANLNNGDIIRLQFDPDGYVIGIGEKPIFLAEKGFEQYANIEERDITGSSAFLSGEVKSIDAVSGRLVLQYNLNDKGAPISFGSGLKIYIYDTEANVVTVASKSDILVGDKVFVGTRYLAAQQMVIFR